jgi:hypothetical protein
MGKRKENFPNTTKHAVPRDIGPMQPSKPKPIRTNNSYGSRIAVKRTSKGGYVS